MQNDLPTANFVCSTLMECIANYFKLNLGKFEIVVENTACFIFSKQNLAAFDLG